MPVKTLAHETWSHIFSYLRRPLPSINQRVKWDVLHQSDLVSVSRVCSLFHDAAIPHLYAVCVVSDLTSFFFGIEDQPDPQRRTGGKVEFLKMVNKLYLIADFYSAAWEVNDCGPEKRSGFVEKTTIACQTFLRIDGEKALLPKLESVCLGAFTINPWTRFWQDMKDEELADNDAGRGETVPHKPSLLTAHDESFFQFLIACRAKTICQYATSGPFAIPSGMLMKRSNVTTRPPPTFIFHGSRPKHNHPVVEGYPTQSECLVDMDGYGDPRETFHETRYFYHEEAWSRWKKEENSVPNELTIFGFMDHEMGIMEKGDKEALSRNMAEHCGRATHRGAHPNDKIHFKPKKEMKACPACGRTCGDGVQ